MIESGKVRAVCRGEIQGGRPRWRALRQVRPCSLHSKVCIFLGGGGLNKRKRLFLTVGAFFGNKLTKYLCSGLCFCLQWRRLNEAAAPDE